MSRRSRHCRRAVPALADPRFLTGEPHGGSDMPDVAWLTETGAPLSEADWNDAARHRLVMLLADSGDGRLAVIVNGDRRQCVFTLPVREGFRMAAGDRNAGDRPRAPAARPQCRIS